MNSKNSISLNLVSLDSLDTSNNIQNISCNNIISHLPAVNNTTIHPYIIDFENVSSISSVSNISNIACANLLIIVVAMLSIIGLGVYLYKAYTLQKYRTFLIRMDTLLMENTPANNHSFTAFIEGLRVKVQQWDKNRIVDLRFFKPGLGVPYRSLTVQGSLTTNHTKGNQYMIIDNNDRYGIALLGMKGFDNRGMVVVKHNGEWVVGCLYEGRDSYIETDLITGDRYRPFPVFPIWYAYHTTIGKFLTSKGRSVGFNSGQKTSLIYEIEKLGLQRRFYD